MESDQPSVPDPRMSPEASLAAEAAEAASAASERSSKQKAARAKRRQEALDPAKMQARWPSLKTLAAPTSRASERAWVAAFTEQPGVMHMILQDIIKHAYAKPGRIGQRPMPREEEVDLQALLHGEFCDDPLIQVLPRLMKVSERAFADRIFMSRSQFKRLLDGSYHPDMAELRAIAAVVKKPPSYFLEYRLQAAQAAFISLITERPGIATHLYRTYLVVKKEPGRVQR